MTERESINVLLHHKEAFEISGKTAEAIDLAISALENLERDRWHVVAEEGNPPKMGFYLWSARGGAVEIDFFDGEKWEKATTYLYEVLAWKYRPKAYTEEES